MELNEMEKKLLFQVEGDYQTKILNELYMTVRYSNNSEQREAAEGLMAKLRVLSNAECIYNYESVNGRAGQVPLCCGDRKWSEILAGGSGRRYSGGLSV